MQNQHFGYKLKGFYKIAYFALREDNFDPIANKRYQAISFYKKHGLSATLDAFNIKRRTLFNWQKTLKDNGYNIAYLAPKSTAPKKCRSNSWQPSVVEYIKMLRERYPNICKDKLFALLLPHCQTNNLKTPSVSTIGRIIANAPNRMRTTLPHLYGKRIINRKPVLRKPKNLRLKPNECLAFDTIERQCDGIRRYIHTAIDPATGVAFAYASKTNSSLASARFLQAIWQHFEYYQKSKILTDNGSEFKKHFSQKIAERVLVHWHTYPKTPKMNAHCERFNRTIQEGIVEWEEDLLFDDVEAFNEKLAQWLVMYNTEIPHLSTKPQPLKTTTVNNFPVPPVKYLIQHSQKCNMYWTNTVSRVLFF